MNKFNTRTTKGGQNDLFDMVEVGIPQSSVVLVCLMTLFDVSFTLKIHYCNVAKLLDSLVLYLNPQKLKVLQIPSCMSFTPLHTQKEVLILNLNFQYLHILIWKIPISILV